MGKIDYKIIKFSAISRIINLNNDKCMLSLYYMYNIKKKIISETALIDSNILISKRNSQ